MGLSAFLNVNGVDWPTPMHGFQYIFSTTVNNGRNANNAVIGQVVGRELIKLDAMQWNGLDPETWQRMLNSLKPFFVKVTLEDYRTGKPMTVTMYPNDRTAIPLKTDRQSHKIVRYRTCKVNLIDAGL